MNELSQLQEKLKQLLIHFYELKEQAVSMGKIISEQKEEIQRLSVSNDVLRKELEQINLNKQINSLPTHQKNDLKDQLDLVLQMIEKNIALLK